jgi:uncharacterized protein
LKRVYESLIRRHFSEDGEMMFIEGPRQVGKTTVSQTAKTMTDCFTYLNWDNQDHRKLILAGPVAIAAYAKLDELSHQKPIIVFDEIHKFKKWKSFLKGFYDTYHHRTQIIVTGSSRLKIFKPGGDSLMGRYFSYRMHPLSVGECLRQTVAEQEIQFPENIDDEVFSALYEFGGFPKPFLKKNSRFSIRWQRLRQEQLIREDIRDLNRIHDIGQLEILTVLLREQATQLINFTNLSNKVRVSVDTIRRWVKTLESFYFCFLLRPWQNNITRSLIKEPKIFLWDWSLIENPGARAENFIASHLLKAVDLWTDLGFGNYELYFLRTLEKKEVDFLVVKNRQPWFLVEVKSANNQPLSKNLIEFQKQLNAPHAFQVVMDLPYVDKNCFETTGPIIVPAKTFLSQLV